MAPTTTTGSPALTLPGQWPLSSPQHSTSTRSVSPSTNRWAPASNRRGGGGGVGPFRTRAFAGRVDDIADDIDHRVEHGAPPEDRAVTGALDRMSAAQCLPRRTTPGNAVVGSVDGATATWTRGPCCPGPAAMAPVSARAFMPHHPGPRRGPRSDRTAAVAPAAPAAPPARRAPRPGGGCRSPPKGGAQKSSKSRRRPSRRRQPRRGRPRTRLPR